jgi:predicted ArsR family transcriptional regulator
VINQLSSHDRPVDHEILWILVGSKGGKTRARILAALSEKPMNANQLAERLELNYHTVTYNVDVLIKNKLIVGEEGAKYGQVYYPSKIFTSNSQGFKKIIDSAIKENDP